MHSLIVSKMRIYFAEPQKTIFVIHTIIYAGKWLNA